MDNQKMDIDILMESTKAKIIQTVNDSGLPPYLTKYILKDVLAECENYASAEIKRKVAEMQKESEPMKNAEEPKEDDISESE